ncbi:MAG: DsbA family protein, partial [Alphaproteobacteria bacterium]
PPAHSTGDEPENAILPKNTDEAARRGAFGAPTVCVGDALFFGQDRLDWVEEALRAC